VVHKGAWQKKEAVKVAIRASFGGGDEEGRSFEEVLEEVAEAGFDGVELMLDPGPAWGAQGPLPMSSAGRTSLRAFCACRD
jgi:sugar phosphate isomerase/epimerase